MQYLNPFSPRPFIILLCLMPDKKGLDFTSRLHSNLVPRACNYLGKASPPTQAGSLSRVTRANYIYFPTKPRNRYLRTSFHFITYTNRTCKIKSYPSKCWPRQTLSFVRTCSIDLLALLGGSALLSAKFPALLGEIWGAQ